jgi:hypothetical protein
MKRPDPKDLFLAAPDHGFEMAADQRALVPRGVRADLLEHLLARTRPEYREPVLQEIRRFHEENCAGGKVACGPITVNIADREIADLLRQILRPV